MQAVKLGGERFPISNCYSSEGNGIMTVRSQVISQSQTSPKTKQYITTITKHTHTHKRDLFGELLEGGCFCVDEKLQEIVQDMGLCRVSLFRGGGQ